MLIEQKAERKTTYARWRGELFQYAKNYIRKLTIRKDYFIIRESTLCRAKVEGNQGKCEVNIDRRICSCKFWKLTWQPYIHAVTFIDNKDHPMWHIYVDGHWHIIYL